MKLYSIEKIQRIPIPVSEAWGFLSTPSNLQKITPEYMGFEITSPGGVEKMYPGQIISYIVRPLAGIPLKWVTEITHINEPYYFVDEQRFGPYAFWHHKHFLKEIEGGTELRDLIHYALPLGFAGRIAHHVLVKKQLEKIFEHRKTSLQKLFGNYN